MTRRPSMTIRGKKIRPALIEDVYLVDTAARSPTRAGAPTATSFNTRAPGRIPTSTWSQPMTVEQQTPEGKTKAYKDSLMSCKAECNEEAKGLNPESSTGSRVSAQNHTNTEDDTETIQ